MAGRFVRTLRALRALFSLAHSRIVSGRFSATASARHEDLEQAAVWTPMSRHMAAHRGGSTGPRPRTSTATEPRGRLDLPHLPRAGPPGSASRERDAPVARPRPAGATTRGRMLDGELHSEVRLRETHERARVVLIVRRWGRFVFRVDSGGWCAVSATRASRAATAARVSSSPSSRATARTDGPPAREILGIGKAMRAAAMGERAWHPLAASSGPSGRAGHTVGIIRKFERLRSHTRKSSMLNDD